MLTLLFAVIGLLLGGVINALADDLPRRVNPQLPHCLQCGHQYKIGHWLAIGRRRCPACHAPPRPRALLVEVGMVLLFALLPTLIPDWRNLIVNSLYIAVLVLIIIIDLEHKLILNVVTFPAALLALGGSFILTNEQNNIWLALTGALAGFIIVYVMYWFGQLAFGPGALGYGDVKLAIVMGAMLGLHRIPFALILAVLLGGVLSAALLLSGRVGRGTFLPYGQYLAIAGIIMLIWGVQIFEWYIN